MHCHVAINAHTTWNTHDTRMPRVIRGSTSFKGIRSPLNTHEYMCAKIFLIFLIVGLSLSLVYTSVIAHSRASTRCKERTFNLSPSLSLKGVC